MTTLKKLIITILLTTVTIPATHIYAAAAQEQEQLHDTSPENPNAQADEENKQEAAAHQDSNQLTLEQSLLIDIINGNINAVIKDLQAGADPNTTKDKEAIPFVATAIASHKKAIVKQLLIHKANINFIDNNGHAPLWYAITANDISLVRLLLDYNASIDSVDSTGTCALRHAIAQKPQTHSDIVKLLLDHKASVNAIDNQGNTPLGIASFAGYADIATILLDYNADSNKADDHYYTPLMYAASQQHPDIAALLLQNKAQPNILNKKGEAPLGMAVANSSLNIVRMLLENKAHADILYEGVPPLFRALNYVNPNPTMVALFLNHLLKDDEAQCALTHFYTNTDAQTDPDNPALLEGKLLFHQLPATRQMLPDCGIHALTNAISINECFKAQQSINSDTIKEHHAVWYPQVTRLLNVIRPHKNHSGTDAIELLTIAKQYLTMDNCCVLSCKGTVWHTSSQPLEHILWGIPDYSGTISENGSILAMIDTLKSKDYGAIHFVCDIDFKQPNIKFDTDIDHRILISLIKEPHKPPYLTYLESNNDPLKGQADAQRWINFINAYYGNRLLEQ